MAFADEIVAPMSHPGRVLVAARETALRSSRFPVGERRTTLGCGAAPSRSSPAWRAQNAPASDPAVACYAMEKRHHFGDVRHNVRPRPGVCRHRLRRSGPVSIVLMLAVAIILLPLIVAGVGLWRVRSRRRTEAPVTEAQARAHALPLSTSILSVAPRSRDDV